jgi:hypothetical protein
VSLTISSSIFRANRKPHSKACAAGNIEYIGKGHNAAVRLSVSSRRARHSRLPASLHSLEMEPPFPADRASLEALNDTLNVDELIVRDTSVLSDKLPIRLIHIRPDA